MANRTTFVIGPDGRIEHIEEGSAAIDPTGAATPVKGCGKSSNPVRWPVEKGHATPVISAKKHSRRRMCSHPGVRGSCCCS